MTWAPPPWEWVLALPLTILAVRCGGEGDLPPVADSSPKEGKLESDSGTLFTSERGHCTKGHIYECGFPSLWHFPPSVEAGLPQRNGAGEAPHAFFSWRRVMSCGASGPQPHSPAGEFSTTASQKPSGLPHLPLLLLSIGVSETSSGVRSLDYL